MYRLFEIVLVVIIVIFRPAHGNKIETCRIIVHGQPKIRAAKGVRG